MVLVIDVTKGGGGDEEEDTSHCMYESVYDVLYICSTIVGSI